MKAQYLCNYNLIPTPTFFMHEELRDEINTETIHNRSESAWTILYILRIWISIVTCHKKRVHLQFFMKIEFLAWTNSSICAESNGASFVKILRMMKSDGQCLHPYPPCWAQWPPTVCEAACDSRCWQRWSADCSPRLGGHLRSRWTLTHPPHLVCNNPNTQVHYHRRKKKEIILEQEI